MKVTVDSKKGLKTNLKVLVDKKTIDDRISTRLIELSKTVNIKGFRPGKVPVDVLKRQFGKAVYGEVLEKVLKETSAKVLEDKKIKVAGQPKLDLKSYGEGKDLNYTLEVNELPSIKIQSLELIKYTDYEINVTDNDIKKRIDEIAKNQNNFKVKNENEVAQEGDLVVFDYKATIENKTFEGGEGKNTQIVLGKDLFIKGFDKQLIGCKKNQEKEVIATLPENYPKKKFSNKKANFKCKILNVKKPETVKIDDQFAKNLGAKDLNDLKQLINKQIQNQYKMNLEALTKESILDQIEKDHKIDLPDNLVQQELALISQGLKKEDVEKNKQESEKIAKKRIKLGLILNEFGEKNNLKVEEQELKKRIKTRSKIQKRKKPLKKKNRREKKKKIYKRKVKRVIKAEKTKLHQREETRRLDEEVEQRLEQQKQEEQSNQPEEEKKEPEEQSNQPEEEKKE